ncbi:MAG: hypothetical protein U0U66_11765 [Cytophagaceae bacterium]
MKPQYQSILYIFILTLISNTAFSQHFKLPPIPKYDSVYVDKFDGKIKEKTYFLNEEKVFQIGYKVGSMFYTPFFHIGGGTEDSCYAYFNGPNHEDYDFYYMAKTYIIQQKYSEASLYYSYKKFDWSNKPIESGTYYYIKEMDHSTISHSPKYKIGKWAFYDKMGQVVEQVDYDKYTRNGSPIKFEGSKKIVDSLKMLANDKMVKVYGQDFVTKYIRFNLDRSGYYLTKSMYPEQPRGYSLLNHANDIVEYVDLSYDIVIDSNRFNVIQFRISKTGEFVGKVQLPNYGNRDFYFTKGLDVSNKGVFHKNVLEWKRVAKEKGFDIHSKEFNVRFDFVPDNNGFGSLKLILEQITDTEVT